MPRRRKWDPLRSEVDQISDCVRKRVENHRKFGGFVGLHTVAKEETWTWSMTEERGRVRAWLMGVAGWSCGRRHTDLSRPRSVARRVWLFQD